MSEPQSQCCGAPAIDIAPGFCVQCHDRATFEELCPECGQPCLIDGKARYGEPVAYDSGDAHHWDCQGRFMGGE